LAEEKKKGWFQRLTDGLSRTSQNLTEQVTQVFQQKESLDAAALEELEDLLIESDLGPAVAATIARKMADAKFNSAKDSTAVREVLAEALAEELVGHEATFDPLSGPKPYVVLFVGVNGSGKTTTLGKIAASLTSKGAKVLVVAGDTFRAAAVEQLKVWAERAKADFMGRKTGADAAGLAFDAFTKAKLMDELLKIVRVIKRIDPDAPHETLLVLDATVGRNALSQEQVFGRQAFVSGLVMTKLDGTARGGILIPVAKASDAPIKLIGVGEDIEDLHAFKAREFARSMVGLEPLG